MISDNYAPTKTLGNGVTTIFSFSWNGLSTDHVKIYFEDVSTGARTEQTTGFTIDLSATGVGGTVTFTTAPTSDNYVIISRETPKAQTDPYTTSVGFQADVVENNLDKIVAMLQESVELAGRALVYPIGTDISGNGYSTDIPIPVALNFLRWNTAGTALENVSGVTSTEYPGSISSGLDSAKSATPATGDLYFATDVKKQYICFSTNVWTEVVIVSTAQVITNKRITKRAYTTTSVATLTPEIDTYDSFSLTAQAANLTIANPSTSTPAQGDVMIFDIVDDGTPRTISFGTDYVAKGGIDLPTTTTASKKLTFGFRYDAGLSKWNLLAKTEEA